MAANFKYKKAGAGGMAERQKLYFGDDHLLVVNGQYKENYRRVFYGDVQAVLRRDTYGSRIVGVLLGLVVLLSVLGMAASHGNFNWGALFFFVPSSIMLGYVIWTKGSCEVGIKTPIQLVRLQAVGNVRRARKFERLLSERVEAEQGQLTKEVLQAAIYGSKSSEST